MIPFLASFWHRPDQSYHSFAGVPTFRCSFIDIFRFLASFWQRPDHSYCIFVVVPARPVILLPFYRYVSLFCFILAPPRAFLVHFCSCPGLPWHSAAV
jgi:hypothetical protein